MSKLDQEYYVMNVDGANNHPILAWGETNNNLFLKSSIIEENELDLPLKIVFREPYIQNPEMADLLMLSGQYAASKEFKELFEKMNVYGIQFFSAEIKDKKGTITAGHFAIQIWNRLPAIDKDNYIGGEPNRFGNILSLQKFSLDAKLLESIPTEERQIFLLSERNSMIIIHQNIYDAIQSANLTGMKFFRVDNWDDNAMFR